MQRLSRLYLSNGGPAIIEPASSRGLRVRLAIRVLTDIEVEQVSWKADGHADGVVARERATGRQLTFQARCVVLAAGAIGSPLLLLRSGLNHPLVGRHYMMHLSPIVIGLFARRLGADEGFVKQVGFTDYYFGTKDSPISSAWCNRCPSQDRYCWPRRRRAGCPVS